MLKSTILCILAFTMPTAFASTEEKACEFATTNSFLCSAGQHNDSIPDGDCFLLHRDMLSVKKIARTCRGIYSTKPQPGYMESNFWAVFIYENKDCTGGEKQVFAGTGHCVDIKNYYSIKAFCH